jgi:hypothetical protein
MKPALTKAQARAFKRRWALVNAREAEELQRTPIEVKMQQINTLMGWVQQFGWHDALAAGEAEVRQRWIKLRRAYRG